MEDNVQGDRSFSESTWQDISAEMDSSSLAEMERISEEANINNEMVTVEASYVNEVVITEVTDEATSMNGILIEAVTDEASYVNEVVITEVTDEATSVNGVVISEETEEVTSESEEVTSESEEVTSESEEKEVTSESEEKEVTSESEEEEEKPVVKMRRFLTDENYFFVEDLIEAVRETRNELEENGANFKSRENSGPNRRAIALSWENKYLAQSYIHSKEDDFISLINESAPNSNILVFETCKERFIETYKPKTYTNEEFVNFCAAIAYLGIHCSARGLDPHAEIKATNYICSLLYDVLQRGLFRDSTWKNS